MVIVRWRTPFQGMTVDRPVAYKSLRLMEAWSEKMLVRTYAVAIGRGSAGPRGASG